MKRGLSIALLALPGTLITLLVVLLIANNGTLAGLTMEWLINCSLIAVPFVSLIGVIVLRVMTFSKPY